MLARLNTGRRCHRPSPERQKANKLTTYQQSPLAAAASSEPRGRRVHALSHRWRSVVPSVEKEEELTVSPVGPLASAEARRRRPLSDGAAPLGAERRRRLACASRECACGREAARVRNGRGDGALGCLACAPGPERLSPATTGLLS